MRMRKFKIIFSPEALVDLKEAKKWYNLQQKGLGEKLVEDVRNATAATKKIRTMLPKNTIL